MTAPRICIRSTPANDFYLLLSRLGPSREVVQLITNPAGVIHAHRAEFRFLRQLAESRGLLGRFESAPVAAAPSDGREPEPEAPASAEPSPIRGSILR